MLIPFTLYGVLSILSPKGLIIGISKSASVWTIYVLDQADLDIHSLLHFNSLWHDTCHLQKNLTFEINIEKNIDNSKVNTRRDNFQNYAVITFYIRQEL